MRSQNVSSLGSRQTLAERVGWRVRQARLDRRISQASLACKVGISQGALSQIERGCRKQVKESILADIEQALDLPPGCFVANEGESDPLFAQLPTSLCSILQQIICLPESQQEEVSAALRWLLEWRYGLSTCKQGE